ncbi:MAG: dimethylargininase, partial [Gemmatimonadota bacterium]
MTLIALTRAVSPAITRCELTHLARRPIDVERAETQHAACEAVLERAGCRVVRVPPAPAPPDAVFVEDTAVVLDEVAIVARPGAASRRPEVEAVADALRPYRPIRRVREPGTLDGGDVLRIDRMLYVGRSARTNAEGRRQLAEIAGEHDYAVMPVELRGCLHLKTAATAVAARTLLV